MNYGGGNSFMGMSSSFVVNPQQPSVMQFNNQNPMLMRQQQMLRNSGAMNQSNVPISAIPPNSNPNYMPQQPFKRRRINSEAVIPETVVELIPESQIFTDLQEFEKRLDKVISDKKLRMRQLLTDPQTTRKTLYIQVSCERGRQNPYEVDPVSDEEEWILRVRGTFLDPNSRIIDDQCKFTSFVNSMLIDFDQEVFPNQKSVEWKRSHTFTDCEGFSFVKKITPATYIPPKADNYDFLNGTGVQAKPNAKVLLFMKHDPPIYHLSPELKKVMLGNSEQQLNIGDDKQNTLGPAMSLNVILSSVWKYILVNKLLDQNEKKVIVCDQALKEVFQTERMTFADIIQKVKEHLIAPAPIEIDFNMNGDATQMKEIPVDIEVQIPTMQRTAVEELLDDKPLKEVEDQNAFILKAVETIKEHKKKRDFMLAFSSDPVPFIHQIIHSQTRDLLIANNRKEMEESRFSNFYKREWVNEAVTRYMENQRIQRELNAQRLQ